MSTSHWLLIAGLAIATFGTRFLGMLVGQRVRHSRFAPLLDDLPGLIVVALIATSLATAGPIAWIAATVATAAAWVSGSMPVTMIAGLAAFVGLRTLIG